MEVGNRNQVEKGGMPNLSIDSLSPRYFNDTKVFAADTGEKGGKASIRDLSIRCVKQALTG